MPSIANAIAVGIGMDTKQLRKDVNYANRIIGQSKAAFRDLGKTLELINLDYKDGSITQNEYTAAINKATLASEKKTAQLKQEAATVKALEAANMAAAAAERKRVQDSLGLGSYSGAKPGSSTGGGSVNSYLNAGSSKKTDSLGLGSYSGAQAGEASGGGSVNSYLNSAQAVKQAAEANAKAIKDSQAALSGWANGLKQLGLSSFAQELSRSRAGQDAWAVGMKKMADASASAKAAVDAITRETQEYNQALRQSGVAFLQQFETSQQRVNREINEASVLYKKGAISALEYKAAVTQIHKQNSFLASSFAQMKGVVSTLLGPLVLTFAAYKAATSSIRLSAELDAATAKFRIFTGSATAAASILKEIRNLSSTAPVSFAGGQRAVTTMLQFGVESRNVVQNLREIAEITGGDTARMESLSLAFAQTQAAGRLMGQELLQMVNAGFNPLKVISEQTGISLVDLKKQMEEGGISAEAVAKAFRDATGDGGRFNGLLDEIADTTAGKLVRTASEIEKLGTALGNLAKPATDMTLSVIARISERLTELVNEAAGVKVSYTDGDKLANLIKLFKESSKEEQSLMGGDKELARWKAVLKAYQNIDDIRARVADGGFISTREKEGLDLANKERDSTNKLNKSDTRERLKKYREDFAAEKDRLGQVKLSLDYANDVGHANPTIDPKKIALLEKEFRRLTQDAADAKRATDAFKDSIDNLEEAKLDSQYGKNANRLKLLVASSADTERSNKNGTGLQDLIDQGAAYSQIYAAANQAAQAEADRLAILEDANRAEIFRQELDNLASQAKYLEEAVTWGKEEARIRQLMRDDGLSRSEAELKRAAEDRLKAEEKIKELRDTAKDLKDNSTNFDKLVNGVAELQALLQLGFIDQAIFDREANKLAAASDQKYGTASAPRAIQAGSTEAFALQAENQAKLISENIRLANRAFTVQKATSEAAKKTSEILDDIKDNLGVLTTP